MQSIRRRTKRRLASSAIGCSVALLHGAACAQIVEFDLPTANAGPHDITAGADGNLWFAEYLNGVSGTPLAKIAKIDTAGAITEYLLPNPLCQVQSLTAADDGIWFTEICGSTAGSHSALARISPSGNVSEFPLRSEPRGIALGPDGNFWIGYESLPSIARVSRDGTITDFPLAPGASFVESVTAGPDGNIWYTEVYSVGRITPAGVASEVAPATLPAEIATGPDGNLWYTEPSEPFDPRPPGHIVARLTPQGVTTQFSTPTDKSSPRGITAGPDGNVWFAEASANAIARIYPNGTVTEFALPTANSIPTSIVTGPDGNLWFTEAVGNKIGMLSPKTLSEPIGGYLSGNWYDSTQPGQGFQLEFARDGVAVAIWYTYSPDGSGQNWIYAQGTYGSAPGPVVLSAELLTGASFVPRFDPSAVTATPWGTLAFSFYDCNRGVATWSSTLPGYGAGSMPIERLTQVGGTSCP